jgi:quercetin dioxygenase-like cupin family protein
MRMIRLYADEAGESHFEDVEVPLADKVFAPPARAMGVSAPFDTRQLVIVRIPGEFPPEWHPTPKCQIWIGLEGSIRVTVSDGEIRTISAGTLWLMEDVSGKGHATVPTNRKVAIGAIAQLE